MRSGFLRSVSGLLSAGAFAIGVASPVQWCPCPMHGATLVAHAEQMPHAHTADMPMPGSESGAASHSTHRDAGSPHAAHQCTCPGGCCATPPVALLGHALRIVPALRVAARAGIEAPADSVELAQSPQLTLPLANAPPAFRITLRSAAQHTT